VATRKRRKACDITQQASYILFSLVAGLESRKKIPQLCKYVIAGEADCINHRLMLV
jgi:hypothetical protein